MNVQNENVHASVPEMFNQGNERTGSTVAQSPPHQHLIKVKLFHKVQIVELLISFFPFSLADLYILD